MLKKTQHHMAELCISLIRDQNDTKSDIIHQLYLIWSMLKKTQHHMADVVINFASH